jgi:GNAT superfamily N-acetyltransferase
MPEKSAFISSKASRIPEFCSFSLNENPCSSLIISCVHRNFILKVGSEPMIEKVKAISFNELDQLLDLYQYLNPDDPKLEKGQNLTRLWQAICDDPFYFCFVIHEGGKLVSACNLIIIRNLTRNARPYALIENVVTHADYRNKGYGTAILKKAVDVARENNCYKVMLMTSRKEESVLGFYEKAGFDKGDKTGFVIRL